MITITCLVIIAYFLLKIAALAKHAGWDSTDDRLNKERSGLALYKDYATGVNYVGTIHGGLTVRLNSEGKPYTGA